MFVKPAHSPRTKIGLGMVMALALLGGCVFSPTPAPTPNPSPTTIPTNPQPTPTLVPSPTSSLPSIAEAASRVRPAVVAIVARSVTENFFLQPVPVEGAGSGVIFDSQGHILTNNHVVEGARELRVTLPDGRSFLAQVIGRDPATDLAVIRISGDDLPTAKFGDSDSLHFGDWVVAIGNALGLPGGPTVTAGVVGALGRSILIPNGAILHDLVQTDAAINPGNSGGPLVNLSGDVIGINTAISTQAQGIGFAVSMATARPVVEQLLTNGEVIWPWIGVSVENVTPILAAEENLPVKEGVLVRGVESEGPADKGDIRPQDIIVAFQGRPIATVRQLQEAIREHKIGESVEVTYLREGREAKESLTLEKMPRGL